jgi:hypothetical protein
VKNLPVRSTQGVFPARKKKLYYSFIVFFKAAHRQTFAFLPNYQDPTRQRKETGDIFHLGCLQGMPHQYQGVA